MPASAPWVQWLFRTRLVWIVLTIAVIAYALSSCNPSYRWSQRLQVEIERDGATYAGHANTRVEWHKNFMVNLSGGFIGRRYQADIVGEAAVIEIEGRNPVFALLQRKQVRYFRSVPKVTIDERNQIYLDHDLAVETVLPRRRSHDRLRNREQNYADVEAMAADPYEVPAGEHPVLVYFADLNDPSTLRVIDDDAELTEVLGAPSRLKSVRLTINRSPPTRGIIAKYLPWAKARTTNADTVGDQNGADAVFERQAGELERQVRVRHFALTFCMSSGCAEKYASTAD